MSLNHPAYIMPNEKTAVDEFLGDLNKVQDDPFKSPEEDPFASVQEEEVKEEPVVTKEDKPVPFHKDPKVIRFIEKEVEKRTSQIKPTETQQFIKETGDDEITDVLTRVIGNDTPEKVSAIKDLRKVIVEREDKGAEKALKILSERQEAEQKAERDAEEQLNLGFEGIEETFDVDLTSNSPTSKKLKTDFVEFITKIAPKNADGQVIAFPDLEASFETFQATRKPAQPNNRAKELSSRSMSRSTDASVPQTKAVNWETVDRLFDKN